MDINEAFPSKYLKASDIKGQVTAAISDVATEDIGDDRRVIVYFRNASKGLVCNKTNATRIADMYGDDTDGWIGQRVTLYVERVNFKGQMVPAIRVLSGPSVVQEQVDQSRPSQPPPVAAQEGAVPPPKSGGFTVQDRDNGRYKITRRNPPPAAELSDDEIPF